MRDEDFNLYAEVEREARHDWLNERPGLAADERPSREDVADLEERAPFTPHPDAVKIGGWTYVRARRR